MTVRELVHLLTSHCENGKALDEIVIEHEHKEMSTEIKFKKNEGKLIICLTES